MQVLLYFLIYIDIGTSGYWSLIERKLRPELDSLAALANAYAVQKLQYRR